MAKTTTSRNAPKSKSANTQRESHSGPVALQSAQAAGAGADFQWHYGRVTRLGQYGTSAVKGVTIVWEEGGATSNHDIADEQWDIFKLAFLTTGRIAILSDESGEEWMYDYRFLEAVR